MAKQISKDDAIKVLDIMLLDVPESEPEKQAVNLAKEALELVRQRICPVCGSDFITINQTYCSTSCRMIAQKNRLDYWKGYGRHLTRIRNRYVSRINYASETGNAAKFLQAQTEYFRFLDARDQIKQCSTKEDYKKWLARMDEAGAGKKDFGCNFD